MSLAMVSRITYSPGYVPTDPWMKELTIVPVDFKVSNDYACMRLFQFPVDSLIEFVS
jgi:hypothetical protein